MRAGGDSRGSSYDRRIRKQWLLDTFGNGITCFCTHCTTLLTAKTLEADRKEPGGSYKRSNIQPSCRKCNAARGNNVHWVSPLAQAQKGC